MLHHTSNIMTQIRITGGTGGIYSDILMAGERTYLHRGRYWVYCKGSVWLAPPLSDTCQQYRPYANHRRIPRGQGGLAWLPHHSYNTSSHTNPMNRSQNSIVSHDKLRTQNEYNNAWHLSHNFLNGIRRYEQEQQCIKRSDEDYNFKNKSCNRISNSDPWDQPI